MVGVQQRVFEQIEHAGLQQLVCEESAGAVAERDEVEVELREGTGNLHRITLIH